ncbi:MAG: nucleotide-diphospho-sugar transferase, partial [Cytophagales bacterium]|nr:nucleotide-diphospho-sugar transferase [Cytophagales bacterium]
MIVFNRPQTTERVFSAIRKVRPQKLYVAADGPRADKADEAEKTRLTREIATRVDWDCEVKTLFRDENVGCGLGPATAISWLFEQEERGIILEDDCQPSESFFLFCEEVLKRYESDNRVMQVSGMNPLGDWCHDPDYDYYFSEAGITWGWATWRRAWRSYDYYVPNFKEMLHKGY